MGVFFSGCIMTWSYYTCGTACLMVWGDFEAGRNRTHGEALLRLQNRFVGLMAGKRGIYHADPLFARFGVLKVGYLYRQQVRVDAWKFWNGRLP